MRLYRLGLEEEIPSSSGLSLIEGRPAHHLVTVRRAKVGHEVNLFNEIVGEWKGIIERIEKGPRVFVQLQTKINDPIKLPKRQLAFGLIKWEACHFLIEKSTELGVTDFFPLITDLTQVRSLNADKVLSVMTDAVQQCGRHDLPRIYPPQSLMNWIESQKDSGPTWAFGQERSQSTFLSCLCPQPTGILIGPEGGLSSQEQKILQKTVSAFSLGPFILRAETAGIVSLGILASRSNSISNSS